MGTGHIHGAGANQRSLAWALAFTGGFMLAEVVGSFLTGSLAQLSDAAHMFTDAAALAVSLAAIQVARRPADRVRMAGATRTRPGWRKPTRADISTPWRPAWT